MMAVEFGVMKMPLILSLSFACPLVAEQNAFA
jgi:hypothetical protein